jgi:Zn-finger nucleic acid-binding protein
MEWKLSDRAFIVYKLLQELFKENDNLEKDKWYNYSITFKKNESSFYTMREKLESYNGTTEYRVDRFENELMRAKDYFSAGDESETFCPSCDCCLDDYDWGAKQFKFCPECGERVMTRNELEEFISMVSKTKVISDEALKVEDWSIEDAISILHHKPHYNNPVIALTKRQYENLYGRIWCELTLDNFVNDNMNDGRDIKIVIYPRKSKHRKKAFHWALIKYNQSEKMWKTIEFGWEKYRILAHLKSQKSYRKHNKI